MFKWSYYFVVVASWSKERSLANDEGSGSKSLHLASRLKIGIISGRFGEI